MTHSHFFSGSNARPRTPHRREDRTVSGGGLPDWGRGTAFLSRPQLTSNRASLWNLNSALTGTRGASGGWDARGAAAFLPTTLRRPDAQTAVCGPVDLLGGRTLKRPLRAHGAVPSKECLSKGALLALGQVCGSYFKTGSI